MDHDLVSIVDPVEIGRLKKILKRITEPSGDLSIRWLQENHKVAVPVESASHFDEHDVELLLEAIKLDGATSCYAIATETLLQFPSYLRLNATKDDLMMFSRKCAHFNFVITPNSCSFAVQCTVFDYFIIAGTTTFVEMAASVPISEARSRFVAYALKSDNADRLLAVANRYEER